MIDPTHIKLNAVVYKVTEHNDYFNRKKIKMTDSDGVEWSRYDRPILRWTIGEYQLMGIVSIAIHGVVEDIEYYTDEYHFKNLADGNIIEINDDDKFWDNCYYDRLDADAAEAESRTKHETDVEND